jgi:L-iditol 2-dehydrogenase
MKSLLYPAHHTLEIIEQPMPLVGPGEALMRVAACGICGSELEAYRHKSPRRPPPLIMGHEFCGELMEVPAGSEFKAGDKVVCNALVACGECVRCKRGEAHLCASRQIFGMHRMGAFAEYVNVPLRALLRWDPVLPASAACLAEPLGNGVHVVNLVRSLNPRNVAVIGAGPIGLLVLQAFKALTGADVVSADLSPQRLEVAKRVGALRVVNAREEDIAAVGRELTDGEGFDVVVDAVGGSFTKKQSVQAARPGGAAVWIGLHENNMDGLATYDITLPEKRVFGSYAATQADMQTALDLMASGKIESASWVDSYSLDRGVEAFNRMLAGVGHDIKGVVQP